MAGRSRENTRNEKDSSLAGIDDNAELHDAFSGALDADVL